MVLVKVQKTTRTPLKNNVMSLFNIKLIFILSFLPFYSFSQEKNITIIIDSIYLNNEGIDFDIQYSYGNLYGLPLIKKATNKVITTKSNELISYKGSVTLNSDSTVLFIPFNNNNDFLKISNLSSLKNKDTIRINKVDILKSDIRDTTFTVIKYFKTNNDFISKKAYRIKKSKKRDKRNKKCSHMPKTLDLVINNVIYSVTLNKIQLTGSEMTTFNGQKPTNSNNPRIIFYGKSEKTNWKYEGIIHLNTQ